MTDDDFKLLIKELKPDGHPVLKWIGAMVACAGVAWGVARWAATQPTREEFTKMQENYTGLRVDVSMLTGSVARMEKGMESLVTAKQDERKGRRGQ